jgi:glycosyltransferase involved in cell wall biosynthesis
MAETPLERNDTNRPRLSVVLIARNEATNLPRALASVNFADEIIVADTGSTDDTAMVARQAGARVIHCAFRGFGPTKAEALSHATGEWILSLDADEEVTPELAEQIRAVLDDTSAEFVAYRLTRQANFLGRWIRHSGWFPDYVLRFFRNGRARVTDDLVHESIIADGRVGTLPGILRHYTDPTIDHYLEKMREYTALAAQQLHLQGRRCHWWDLAVRPPWMFLRMYFLKLGFLDGWQGLVLAVFSSVHVFTKYARLKSLQ